MSGPTIDTTGMRCPKPVIELARAVRDLPDRAELTVLSTDPAAPGDIGAWCRMRGHELVSQVIQDGTATSVVRVTHNHP